MREFRVTVKDEVQNNSLLCRVVPSVIDIGGIAREHNATRIAFVLPESWNTDEGSFFVECESNNGEAALSVALSVTTENGAKVIYFDIPYGMTAAGTSELTLKQETFDEDGKTLIKCVRSAKLRVRFSDSTTVDGENRKLAEDLLGGMSAEINDLVTRFNNGEFNGTDGEKGEKGEKGEPGADATINGKPTLRIQQGEGITFKQKGEVLTISSNSVPRVYELPVTAEKGEICLYNMPALLAQRDENGRIVLSKDELAQLSTSAEPSDYILVFYRNGVYLMDIGFACPGDKVLRGGVTEFNFEGEVVFEVIMHFDNGEFNQGESYIFANGETSHPPLSDYPEAFDVPVFDSLEYDSSGDLPERFGIECHLMEYDNGWTEVDLHTHRNKKTIDGFYCEALETGFQQDASSTDLKWNGASLRFANEGAVVERVEPTVNAEGKSVFRLWLDWGNSSFVIGKNFVDIPVESVKDTVIEGGDIVLNGAELQFTMGGSGVYVGPGDMPPDCNVQINPEGMVLDVPTKTSELENDSGFITATAKVEIAETTAKIIPNTDYSFGETAELTITFAEGEANIRNEYMFSFISGETATVLTLPSTVKWVNELTVEANKRYEISVVDDIALWCAVEVSV